jgi:rSAM/selenodomain-associated transferase 1
MSSISAYLETRRKNVLIVVAKRPAPGRTKTRLAPPLSLEQASTLYECFLRDTLDLIRKAPGAQYVIAYLPGGERHYFSRLAPDFGLLQQEGLDLGDRLDNAVTHYLKLGYRNVVIMDSDSPTLPASCLVSAFAMLEDGSDAVIGPCDDGGYYLIGLKRPYPRLLREVRMSTPNVTADTLALASEENLQVGLLPAWYDVDDYPSLRRLFIELAVAPDSSARYTRQFLMQPSLRELFGASPGEPIASMSCQKPQSAE